MFSCVCLCVCLLFRVVLHGLPFQDLAQLTQNLEVTPFSADFFPQSFSIEIIMCYKIMCFTMSKLLYRKKCTKGHNLENFR